MWTISTIIRQIKPLTFVLISVRIKFDAIITIRRFKKKKKKRKKKEEDYRQKRCIIPDSSF